MGNNNDVPPTDKVETKNVGIKKKRDLSRANHENEKMEIFTIASSLSQMVTDNDDLLGIILSFLPFKEKFRLRRVSKKWNQILNKLNVWYSPNGNQSTCVISNSFDSNEFNKTKNCRTVHFLQKYRHGIRATCFNHQAATIPRILFGFYH